MTAPEKEPYARFTRPGGENPDLGLFVDAVVEDAKGWAEAQKSCITLAGSERVGKFSGTLLVTVIMALLVSAVLVMSSVALAIWLGHVVGDMALGFLLVAGLYLVFTIVFYLVWRHMLRDRVTLSIINAAHGKD